MCDTCYCKLTTHRIHMATPSNVADGESQATWSAGSGRTRVKYQTLPLQCSTRLIDRGIQRFTRKKPAEGNPEGAYHGHPGRAENSIAQLRLKIIDLGGARQRAERIYQSTDHYIGDERLPIPSPPLCARFDAPACKWSNSNDHGGGASIIEASPAYGEIYRSPSSNPEAAGPQRPHAAGICQIARFEPFFTST